MQLDQRYFFVVGLLALVYAVAALAGHALAPGAGPVTQVWPPSGIALAAVILLGYRYWPGILLGSFVASVMLGDPAPVATLIAGGNTLEALAGAFLIFRFSGFNNTFRSPRDVVVFGLASVASALIAAIIGALSLALAGLIDWDALGRVVYQWWQADLMGNLVYGTFLLAVFNRRAYLITKGRMMEFGLLLATMFAGSMLTFSTNGNEIYRFPFFLYPLLVWAALRFTQLGVVSAIAVMSAVALWGTVNGLGPFASSEMLVKRILDAQLFVSVVSATWLFLAMAVDERLAIGEKLEKQAQDLKRLDAELKEANRRVTRILAGILDEGARRRSTDIAREE